MGKHVKKKTESIRFPLRKNAQADNFVADTWMDAAQREGELNDLNLEDASYFADDLSWDDALSLDEDLSLRGGEPLPDDRVEEILVTPEEELSPEEEDTPPDTADAIPEAEDTVSETEDAALELDAALFESEENVPEEDHLPAPETVTEAEPESILSEEPTIEEEFVSNAPVPDAAEEKSVPDADREEPVIAESFSSRPTDTAAAQPIPKKKPQPRPARSAASAKKKKRRRAKKFKKGLKAYAIIMLCLIAAICAVLWVLLSRYQRGVDEKAEAERIANQEAAAQRAEAEAIRRAPQLAFEAWAATADSEYWTDMWFDTHPMELESREMVLSFMEERFSAAVPYKSADYTDEVPVYVLRNGDDTLSRITLSGGGTEWAVSQVELLVSGDKSASVSAITGSRIFCNGIELGQEYITESSVSFNYAPLADRLVNPVSMMTYTVDGLLAEPTLTAEPPEGYNLVKTEDGGFLLCLPQAEGQALADKAVNFVRAYLYYFMSGLSNTYGNLSYALSFLTQGTQAYSDLQDTLNGVIWNTAYANIDTSDTTASDVVIWADNCRSVDISYSAKCTLNGEPIDYADATMRVYFLMGNNGNFYISNYETL